MNNYIEYSKKKAGGKIIITRKALDKETFQKNLLL